MKKLIMKKTLLVLAIGCIGFSAYSQTSKRSAYEKKSTTDTQEKKRSAYDDNKTSDVYMLPEDFKVYVKGNQVVNQPATGYEQRTLPVKNHYKGADGGYVAVYTKKAQGTVYSVGGGIYVLGMVRVKGKYIGSIFYPEGYNQGDNITQDAKILAVCNGYFPTHKNQLWIGGDTGGFYQNPTKKEEGTPAPKKRKAFE